MPRGAITDRVPDTGAQRGDGREVLRARAEGQRQIGPETLQWLLAESWDIDPSLFGVVRGVADRRGVGGRARRDPDGRPDR